MTREPWAARATSVLAGAVLVVGCGISTQDAPQTVPAADLPSSVAGTDAQATTQVSGIVKQPIFLLEEGQLVRVTRTLDPPANVEDAVNALLAGPTEEEVAEGLRSALVPGTTLLSSTVDASVATLDLSSQLADVGGQAQRDLLGQLVWTATAVPGVDAVTIAVEGTRVAVPGPDGELVDRPLTRTDFPSQATSGRRTPAP